MSLNILDYSTSGEPGRLLGVYCGLDRERYEFNCAPKPITYPRVREFLREQTGQELPELDPIAELKNWASWHSPVLLVVRRNDPEQVIAHLSAVCGMTAHGGVAYLHDLVVLADHRRQGVATALVHKMHWVLTGRAVRVVHATAPAGDTATCELFESLSYKYEHWSGERPISLSVRLVPTFEAQERRLAS